MRFQLGVISVLSLIFLASCEPNAPPRTAENLNGHGGSAGVTVAEIELVESAPIETTLDHPDVRNAPDVWPEMIDRAKTTIELAHFYASEAEDENQKKTSRLGEVITALERATKRGVKVRFLADQVFAPKYPATLDQLRAIGVTVKIIDCAPRYGGVQHAKYMIIDRTDSFVGSQNFDWRALSHIQEMGMRVRSPVIAGALEDLFETDWTLADRAAPADFRMKAHVTSPPDAAAPTGEEIHLYETPKGWLPDESRFDLPHLVSLLEHAKSSVAIQVLLYSTQNRDKSAFTTLDDAVRRAAARGVKVRLLVSHWNANANSHSRKSIEALLGVPNIELKILTIPPWSGGDIPFARVAHAKFMIADGKVAWIGTSNWEGDYFLKTRNVSVVIEGGALPARLQLIFEDDWTSPYATPFTSRTE